MERKKTNNLNLLTRSKDERFVLRVRARTESNTGAIIRAAIPLWASTKLGKRPG